MSRPSNSMLPRGDVDQAQQRAAGGRLAAARLADQRQRLAGVRDRSSRCSTACTRRRTRPKKPAAQVEARGEAAHAQQRRRCRRRGAVIGAAATARRRCAGGVDVRAAGTCAGRSVPVHRAQPRHRRQQRPRVADAAGAAKIGFDRRLPRPSRRCHITTTRSATSATTPMSWVMKITRHPELVLQQRG